MHYALVVFSCCLAVVAAFGGRGDNGPVGGRQGPHLPPFLQSASANARMAFIQIISNETATKGEIDTAVKQWTAANNLSTEEAAFETEVKAKIAEHKQNITDAIAALPAALSQMKAIEEDQTLTVGQTFEKLGEQLDSFSPQLRAFVFAAAFTVHEPKGRRGFDSAEQAGQQGGFGGSQGGRRGGRGGFAGGQGGFGGSQGLGGLRGGQGSGVGGNQRPFGGFGGGGNGFSSSQGGSFGGSGMGMGFPGSGAGFGSQQGFGGGFGGNGFGSGQGGFGGGMNGFGGGFGQGQGGFGGSQMRFPGFQGGLGF